MIHYLCASPKPRLKGSDALYNEICSLKERYGGSISHLYPFTQPSSKYPTILYGVHNIVKLLRDESKHGINHVFASTLFSIPCINLLNNPIIYNVVGSINKNSRLPKEKFLLQLNRIVVSNKRDKDYLESQGVNNVDLVQTGIDFQYNDCESELDLKQEEKLTLLLSSAPWEHSQFESKGIHLLLEAAKKMKNLKLIFIWRDVLTSYMKDLIKKYDVEQSVELINEKVNIKDYLKRADGVVLLADSPTIVKSYPHSLLEGLLSGIPVLVSSQIPISDYVNDYGCGLVLNSHNINELINKLHFFHNYYSKLKLNSTQINKHRFNYNNMIDAYGDLYDQVLLESRVGRRLAR